MVSMFLGGGRPASGTPAKKHYADNDNTGGIRANADYKAPSHRMYKGTSGQIRLGRSRVRQEGDLAGAYAEYRKQKDFEERLEEIKKGRRKK